MKIGIERDGKRYLFRDVPDDAGDFTFYEPGEHTRFINCQPYTDDDDFMTVPLLSYNGGVVEGKQI
jgi:hypothetical protein